MPVLLQYTEEFTISAIIKDDLWSVPPGLMEEHSDIWQQIIEVPIAEHDEEELVWQGSSNGEITVKSAYEFYRENAVKNIWFRKIWVAFIPLKFSLFGWRILHGRVSTTHNLFRRKTIPAAVCISCIVGAIEEDYQLFLKCTVAENIWSWLMEVLKVNFNGFNSIIELLKWSCKQILGQGWGNSSSS